VCVSAASRPLAHVDCDDSSAWPLAYAPVAGFDAMGFQYAKSK